MLQKIVIFVKITRKKRYWLGIENLSLKGLTLCDRWRIKLNPGKTHLLNFSQRKVIKDTSISMYGQPLKVTDSVKFLGVHIDNHFKVTSAAK